MTPTLLIVPALVAYAAAQPPQAVRGLASQVDVEYVPHLRARADQSPNSTVLVRIAPGTAPGHQRVEFIGAVAGNFDLRDYLEREDGQPLADLSPIPVTVVSKLPANAGVDLYDTDGTWLNWRVHYRELMWGAVALWLTVPAAALAVRAIRRPRPAPPPPPAAPPPSVADQLRAVLQIAKDRPLSVDESGQLELLLLRYLGGPAIDQDADLAGVLRDVRDNEATRPLVLAIERWLHAKGGGNEPRSHAADALEALRRTRLAPHSAEAAV